MFPLLSRNHIQNREYQQACLLLFSEVQNFKLHQTMAAPRLLRIFPLWFQGCCALLVYTDLAYD